MGVTLFVLLTGLSVGAALLVASIALQWYTLRCSAMILLLITPILAAGRYHILQSWAVIQKLVGPDRASALHTLKLKEHQPKGRKGDSHQMRQE
jgi:hypothetical protein